MKILLLFVVACAAFASVATAEVDPTRKFAVIVGANAAVPGRQPLRYAHSDADNVADVLLLSGVPQKNIHVLKDPEPNGVLNTIDLVLAALAGSKDPSILFFYYSGHADEKALFPRGKQLRLDALRSRLDSTDASIRIGVVDACRGGGWTGTKGLTETDVFEVTLPFDLSNEGSVLIASSSGLEDAHESEILQGSFFTHHWIGGLRGAGDRNQDQVVTLTEAFDYARFRTIRDTAIHTSVAQNPSFRMNLK